MDTFTNPVQVCTISGRFGYLLIFLSDNNDFKCIVPDSF